MAEFQPFTIHVHDDELADLAGRLGRTRWPEAETVDDWSQGVPLAYVQELCRLLGATSTTGAVARPGSTTCRSSGPSSTGSASTSCTPARPQPDALPLVMTHGWPGSVVEFLKVIGPLIDPPAHGGDPADAFHVVCPSLPGLRLQRQADRDRAGASERIADAWAELMARLGYERYGAQGGDWGSMVTTDLGRRTPSTSSASI